MGLDAYAGFQEPQPENVEPINDDAFYDTLQGGEFYWRKHSRLQQYMQDLWRVRTFGEEQARNMTGLHMDGKHDLAETIFLTKEDILDLQAKVRDDNLPFCSDGFFWGQQFQEEAMKDFKQQDLKFCKDALRWLEEGKEVWYESSW